MVPVGLVHVTVVLDFMCPWSFIGMRSLSMAMSAHAEYARFNVTMVPFEFDPPGTYETLGMDWTEYCNSYEPATAKYLLEEKLPRAFQLGKELGIAFDMRRRIVETEGVNLALTIAQRHGQDAAMQFALTMLSEHFEHLHDPNDPVLLVAALSRLGVPTPSWVVQGTGKSVFLSSSERMAANAALTRRGRELGGGGVPHFTVRCGNEQRGVAGSGGSATSPRYFEKLFGTCLTPAQQREIRHSREARTAGEHCDATGDEGSRVKTDDESPGVVIDIQGSSHEVAASCNASSLPVMRVGKVTNAQPSCPTGNCDDFTVMEAFTGHHSPNGREVSPFLLMHDFGEPTKPLDTMIADDPGPPQTRAEKIVGWHPHRGFDIITYMKEGRGSHADSLGNQAVVRPGGIQWLRCGSGIEHAEGGGNPVGANTHGFQIWINLERQMKMADPSYGTIQPEDIVEEFGDGGGISRIVGGIGSGAFEPEPRNDFVIVDCEIPGANSTHRYEVPAVATRRVLVYCYQGEGVVGGTAMKPKQTAYMNAVPSLVGKTGPEAADSPAELHKSPARASGAGSQAIVAGAVLEMVSTSTEGFGILIFAGSAIDEPISWRGPIVMSTQAEINLAYSELRSGTSAFYKKRASGDWRAKAEQSDVPYNTKRVARPLPGGE